MLFSWIFPANVRWIAIPSIIVLVSYWICRLVFILWYPQTVSQLGFTDWLSFIELSFRFDISTFAAINFLFWFVLLLPFPAGKVFLTVIRFLFVGINSIFLILNGIDIPFFAFNTRRTSYPALKFLLEDSVRQVPQLMVNYYPVVLIFFLGTFLLFRSFPRFPTPSKPKYIHSFSQIVFWMAISVLLVRNSFQLKPLMPGQAFTLSQSEAGHAILNTPFLLFKTTEIKELPDQKWLTENELYQQFPKPPHSASSLKGYNVVLLILESFATEYTGLEGNKTSYSPFLDSLAKTGTYFPHHFANGRTSRDALPSILASVPAWMDEAFASSPYVSVKLNALGKNLKKQGYQTAFFHGGKNGTMSFDVFSRISGFSQYYGLNEYPDRTDFDGNWGIFDEPFLHYVSGKLTEMKQPFAAGIFTLSSHQPYTIPEKYKNRFKKGPLPIHEAISYSDFALRRFFENASTKPWFSKTLFVITADHTQGNHDPAYSNFYGSYDVPLILFCPGQKIVADTSRWVQHLDIAPGILDLLGSENGKRNALGTAFLSKETGYPIQYQDGSYHLLHPQGILMWKGESANNDWVWVPTGNHPEPPELRKKIMSRVQYYRQGLLHNMLFQNMK